MNNHCPIVCSTSFSFQCFDDFVEDRSTVEKSDLVPNVDTNVANVVVDTNKIYFCFKCEKDFKIADGVLRCVHCGDFFVTEKSESEVRFRISRSKLYKV
jgi:DNA-directed RNA polymerase subunit RPC12/RpoP